MMEESKDDSDREKWMPCEGVRVNRGREATPLGNDEILPFVDIPDWLSEAFRESLESKKIRYSLWTRYLATYDPDVSDDEPCQTSDRIGFPEAEPLVIQRIVDSTVEECWPGWVNSLGLFFDPRMEFRVAFGIFEEAKNILDRPLGTLRERLRWALEHFASVDNGDLPGGEARVLCDHVGVARNKFPPEEPTESLLDLLPQMADAEVLTLATKIREIADYIRYRLDSG